MPSPPPNSGVAVRPMALVVDDHDAVGDAHLVGMPARRHLDLARARFGCADRRCRRSWCPSDGAYGRYRASCRRPRPGRRPGNRCARAWLGVLAACAMGPVAPVRSSMLGQAHGFAGGVAAMLLVEGERLQGRLVAGDEQDRRLPSDSLTCSHQAPPGTAKVSNGSQSSRCAVDDAVARCPRRRDRAGSHSASTAASARPAAASA